MAASARPGAWAALMWNIDSSPAFAPQRTLFLGGSTVEDDLPEALQDVSLGCLTLPPDGLGMVALRDGDAPQALRDGVKRGSDWYEPRTVTLTVQVQNDDCPGCPTARAKVRHIEKVWGRYEGQLSSGELADLYWLVLWPDCYAPGLVGTDEQVWSGPYMLLGRPRGCVVTWHYSSQGRATVSLRFDAVDQRLIMPVQVSDGGGGVDIQPSECLEIVGPGGGVMVVRGTECVHPLVRVTGPAPEPVEVEFQTQGQDSMTYRFNRSLGAGETLVLDTRNKVLAAIGGIDYNSDLEFEGNIGPVGPGLVDVTFTLGAGGDESSSAEVCWENHVNGA